MFLWIDSIKAR